MILHTVKEGDSVYLLAKQYNTTVLKIVEDNGLRNPNELVIGQVLVIITDNNIDKKSINVSGYTYPYIKNDVLGVALAYLTSMYIFSYKVNEDGTLDTLNDEGLIEKALGCDTLPVMVVTNLDMQSGFNANTVNKIFSDESIQETLINNIIDVMQSKGYYSVDIDFEYLNPEDGDNYISFLRNLANQLHLRGYKLSVAVAPKYSSNQKGRLYEAFDYQAIGDIVDKVLIMTYEWGYIAGPPMAIAPIDEVEKIISYAITQIESNKIRLGIPNYGYDWTLPFECGDRATTISNVQAIEIAKNNNASIEFDEQSMSPFFRYYDSDKRQHEVWFEDARSINAKLDLVEKYNLDGVFYWTIMKPFIQNWTVLDYRFNIIKYKIANN